MGSTTTHATHSGIGLSCLVDEANQGTGIVQAIQWFVVPKFYQGLQLMGMDSYEQANWTLTFQKDTRFMYRNVPKLKSASVTDVSNPSKMKGLTNWVRIQRQRNGLKTIPTSSPNDFNHLIDLKTGVEIPRAALQQEKHVLKHCQVLAKTGSSALLCMGAIGQQADNQSEEPRSAQNPAPINDRDHDTAAGLSKEQTIVRVCLIGPGLCTEGTDGFKHMPIKVVSFIEIGKNFEHAKETFPDAQALSDIRKVNEDIEQDKLNIVEFDLLVCSFPCYKNTQLRDENGGNYHPSGDLFTEEQMKFISLVKPKHVLNEMTPTRVDYYQEHDAVVKEFKAMNYFVETDQVDCCTLGDLQSRFRWFALASTSPIKSFDVCKDSGMSCFPRGLNQILQDEDTIPESLYVFDTPVQHAPDLVQTLFDAWKTPKTNMLSILPHENALACVLLAWVFAKKHKELPPAVIVRKTMTIGCHGPQPYRYQGLKNPSLAFVFTLLAREMRHRQRHETMFEIKITFLRPAQCDVYFGTECDGHFMYFSCVPKASPPGPRPADVVAFLNVASPGSCILTSGGVRYVDVRNALRSKIRATLCHSYGRFKTNDPELRNRKGTTAYRITGPAPTITSDFNMLIDVSSRCSPESPEYKHVHRYMTIKEGSRATSLTPDAESRLESLDEAEAYKLLGNAIPRFTLIAVYMCAHKHITGLVRQNSDNKDTALDATVLDATTLDPKRKYTLKPSKALWRKCPHPTSEEYAQAKLKVDWYHTITHRSWELIENDILINESLGLQPGDTRMMSPCPICEANKGQIPIIHHSPSWHENEMAYTPLQALMIDIWDSPVKSMLDGFTYILVCVCIRSGLVIDIGMKRLNADHFINAIVKVYNQIKLEYGITLKLLVTDSFSTFKDGDKVLQMKLRLNIEIEPLPPYLHNYNYAENYIKILRNGAVVRIQQLAGLNVLGKPIVPEQFLPEAFRHMACSLNQSSSSSILRKYGIRTTPRQLCSESGGKVLRDLPLYPFGCKVDFVNNVSKLKTTGRGEDRDIMNKSRLKTTPAIYLHPANYHHERFSELKSTSLSVLMLVTNGKPVTTTNFRPTSMSKQNQIYLKSQMTDPNQANPFIPKEPDRTIPSSKPNVILVPGSDSCKEQPKPAATSQRQATPVPSTPPPEPDGQLVLQVSRSNVPSTPILTTTPQSSRELVLRDASDKGPYSPTSQLDRDINDQLSGLLRRVSTDRGSPRDLWPDSPTVVPSPSSTVQEPPLTSSSPKVSHQKFRKPKVGDLIRIRSKDGEWMGTPPFKIMRGKTKPQLSDSTPGATVQASDIRVIRWDPETKEDRQFDLREKRFGPSSDPKAVWHFANPDGSEATSEAPVESVTITQVQDMQPDEHTPDDTYVSFFTSAGCPTNDYSEAARRITTQCVPGYRDKFQLLGMMEASQQLSDLMVEHIADIPCPKEEIIAERMLQAILNVNDRCSLSRIKNRPRRFIKCNSPNNIDRALTPKEYVELGGTRSQLLYEVKNKTVEVGHPDVQGKFWMNSLIDGHSNLDSAFLSSTDLQSSQAWDRAEAILAAADSAHQLWDVALVGAYDLIGNYPTIVTQSGDSLDHLFSSYFSEEHEENVEKVLNYCLDKHSQVLIALQMVIEKETTSQGVTIKEDDIVLDEESILELKSEPLEHKREYLKAIMKEFADLCRNECFSLEVIPEERSPISTKIVLKIKRKGDGSFDKYKARCVVRGFLATIGLDFYATYSPASSMTTARTLMALAVHHGLPIHHSDIAQAFIQTTLDRPIYINFPKGVDIRADLINKVQEQFPNSKLGIRLLRSLYGLKQAPMLWNKKLNSVLLEAKFVRSKNDTSLYVYESQGKWVACAVFVDDILVTGTDTRKIIELKALFKAKFRGEHQWDENINSFLGMAVYYDIKTGILTMDVKAKIDDMFEKFPFLGDTKLDSRSQNSPHSALLDDLPEPDDDKLTKYQELLKEYFPRIVGSCIYLSITCRPDISTIVSKACKGMHGPKKVHILYLQMLIRYLKGHRDLALTYTKQGSGASLLLTLSETYPELTQLPSSPVVGFSDADWLPKAQDGESMKSTSGLCFYCFGNLVQWSSKRQTITAGSTMQAELIAASSGADSGVWYYTLQVDFPILFGIQEAQAVPLLIDNKAALSVANHPESSPRTRHICLREFRIRDMHEAGQIRPYWCPGTHNVADMFTKILPKLLYHRFLSVMGMTGSNLIHSPFPALNALLAPQYEGDIVKECICEKVDSDEEKSIYKWKTSHSFDSQVATALWTQYNTGADSKWFEENLLVYHSVSLLNPQPSNENQDGPNVSTKSKLAVARTLYKQEMAKRATRLVQDHRRRGLSPSVSSCQTASNTNSSFVLTDHKYASLATCIECALLSMVFLWVMSNPQGDHIG